MKTINLSNPAGALTSEESLARLVRELPDFRDHEEVLYATDDRTGLRALIAVHNSSRGPGVGGTRLWSYGDLRSAVTDVLRLSRGMTYKNAMAELPFGGGKAVILAPERPRGSRQEMMRAFGRAVSRLEGRYFTAEDVGTSCDDMTEVRKETPWVFGLADTSGDPSPHTARGVLLGIEASVEERLRTDSLREIRVLVQGIGHVGYHLCRMLHEKGADLVVSDLNHAAVDRCEQEFGARAVSPDQVYAEEADVYAPCALGATVNAKTLDTLKVSIIAGAANNQLADDPTADDLRDLGILYAPDYLINAGGIINIACEMDANYRPDEAERLVARIKPRLQQVYERARISSRTTTAVAEEIARERFVESHSRTKCRVADLGGVEVF